MRKSLSPAERGFKAYDRQRLAQALTRTDEARVFRRMPAVRLSAEGRTVVETSHLTGWSLQAVYNLVHRSLPSPQVQSLHDRPHTGRPPDAPELTAAQSVRELRRSPLRLGDRTTVWTVKTLAGHLSHCSQYPSAPWTLRRRLKHLGLGCQRPRYFSSEQPPHRAPKKGPLCGTCRTCRRRPSGALQMRPSYACFRAAPPVVPAGRTSRGAQYREPCQPRPVRPPQAAHRAPPWVPLCP